MSSQSNNPPVYHITLLRHGESIGNAEGYHQGQAEFPLTEKGRLQAHALAKFWLKEGRVFDQAIASPQSRAKETAEIITSSLGVPLEFDEVWMERDNGIYAGLRHTEAMEKYPQPDFIPSYEPIGEEGESQWELYLRGGIAVQSLIHRPPGRYLVASHGGLLNMAMYAILGITPPPNFHGPRFRFRNTSYVTLSYYPDRHIWYVHGINQRDHWNESETMP
ncbi:MAG: histidine phosphatase family protein [Anaerolineales bacterium]|nr:histidine phosphatase family protein [Chloroflexota bacterium]MBL6981777.1 histidine phosphatase family protein [Anaerolineales bacterium]